MSWFAVLTFIIGLVLGYSTSWLKAYNTIATECQRLGSFYVGSKTFKCIEIKEK